MFLWKYKNGDAFNREEFSSLWRKPLGLVYCTMVQDFNGKIIAYSYNRNYFMSNWIRFKMFDLKCLAHRFLRKTCLTS